MSPGRSEEEREAARRARTTRRSGVAERTRPVPRRSRAPRNRPRRSSSVRRRRAGALVILTVAAALVAVVAWFLLSVFQPGAGDGNGRVRVRVPAGAGARQIGDLLAKRGIVSSGFFFSLRASLEGKRGDLHSGPFVLRHDMSYAAAFAALSRPPVAPPVLRVTIPEGRTLRAAAPLVAQAGIGGSYRAAARRALSAFPLRRYGAPASTPSLEGFLFPATYELVRRTATADRLVAEQLAALRRNLAGVDLRAARRRNLTAYDVLIIASMVEGEARVQRDRPRVAAVIYNRLKAGEPLGIDATIAYANHAVGQALTRSELAADGPYNTYKHTGLPPTPIGNAGLAAIRAAAHPARVPYRYYVVDARNPCTHVFTASYGRFLAAQAAYRRAQESGKLHTPADCTGR